MSIRKLRHRHGIVPVDILMRGSFIDTIVLRMPRLMRREDFAELEKSLQNSAKQVILDKWKRADGHFVLGLQIHQPSREALEVLQNVKTPFRITQVHIALDLITRTKSDASVLQRYVEARFIKNGRPSRLTYWPMARGTDIETESVYFDRGIKRGSEVVLYSDNASKPFKECPCLHVEWRLRGRALLRMSGLDQPQNLLDLRHTEFWDKRLRLWSSPSRSMLIQARTKQLRRLATSNANRCSVEMDVDKVIRASSSSRMAIVNSDLLHLLNSSKNIAGQRPKRLFSAERHDWMLPPQENAMWDCRELNGVDMKSASPAKIEVVEVQQSTYPS